MRASILTVLFLLTSICVSTSQADIIFSSSGTDPLAGGNVTAQVGQSSSVFVWVSTEPTVTISGLSFNILSSNTSVASGVSHQVQNPTSGDPALPRWGSLNNPTFNNANGNILHNHRVFFNPTIAPGRGISTGGLGNFVLHSQLNFNATQIGTTNLTFTATTAGVSYVGVSGNQWNNVVKGTGSITAVPEPASALVLLLGATGCLIARRRRS